MMIKDPAVMVRVTPEQHELLKELGALEGRSMASFLNELLDGAEPLFRALLPVLRAAETTKQNQPSAIRDRVVKVLTGIDEGLAQVDLLQHLADLAERTEADRTGPQRKRGPDRTASDRKASR